MSMMPLTAAFVVGSRTVWEQAHACIQNLPIRLAVEQGMDESVRNETDALLDRIERHRVDVVLVETNRIALPLEEFVGRLKNMPSQPAVFVLNPEPSPELILEALRAGANEYLYPPLAEPLKNALERLSAARTKGSADASTALGRLYGFMSARGGCGATTFAVHVALNLAKQMGAGSQGQPILLGDFDFEAGLVRFLLKSKSTYTVHDAIENLRRMDSSLWKALVSRHSDKLEVIAAPEEIAAKKAPAREDTVHLMRFIRSIYQAAIVDFGRSVNVAALDALPEMDLMYLVTTPDLASLEHCRRALRTLEDRGFTHNRVRVLLNRAGNAGKTNSAEIERALGRRCDAMFRDEHMALYDAYAEGGFLPPGNGLGKELHALAASIRERTLGEQSLEATAQAQVAGGKKRWFGLLQKTPPVAKTMGVQA